MSSRHRIDSIGLGIGAGLLALLAAALVQSKRWRAQTERRLREGSIVVSTDRGPIEVAQAGRGSPVLVLHGSPGGYDQALGLDFLTDHGYRIVAPSRPGYLRTPLDVGRTPEEQADAMAALLQRLGIERAAVIGISGGGPSAVQLALRHPERTSRLVLVAAITQATEVDLSNLDIMGIDLVAWAGLTALRLAPRLALPRAAADSPAARARIMRLAATTLPLDPRRAGMRNDEAQFRALPAYPLRAVTAPTLLIHGTADTEVPYAQSQAAAEMIPAAELLTLPSGDHRSTMLSDAVPEAILAFLRRGSDGHAAETI